MAVMQGRMTEEAYQKKYGVKQWPLDMHRGFPRFQ
jgi:hypothetical protein